MTNLFVQDQSSVTGGSNQLEKTAELNQASTTVVNKLFDLIKSNEEQYAPIVLESQKDHEAMDRFIRDNYDLTTVDTAFLADTDEETLEKMLKSQQSKRSRLKAMAMTMATYKSLMTGAVAELILRQATGKAKSVKGVGFRTTSLEFTEEQLEALANDSEALGKAIRNIQSKKSIMKSKADFDEASEKWQQLLDAEETLKSMRSTSVRKVDTRLNSIEALFVGLDVDKLKVADAKSLLTTIDCILRHVPTEDTVEDGDSNEN